MKQITRYKTQGSFSTPQKQNPLVTKPYFDLKKGRKSQTPSPQLTNSVSGNPTSTLTSYPYGTRSSRLTSNSKIQMILNASQKNELHFLHLQNPEAGPAKIVEKSEEQSNDRVMAKDYLRECHREKYHKQQLYGRFRCKFVRKFPSMKKYYTEYSTGTTDESVLYQTVKPSSKKDSLEIGNSPKNIKPRCVSIRDTIQSEISQIPQRKQLSFVEEVAKLGYFFSRSKNRCLTSFYQDEEKQEKPKVKEGSQFNYLKYQKNRKPFKKLKNSKDSNIAMKLNKLDKLMSNQHLILDIEKQGTHAHNILKKSFEEAIELSKSKY